LVVDLAIVVVIGSISIINSSISSSSK